KISLWAATGLFLMSSFCFQAHAQSSLKGSKKQTQKSQRLKKAKAKRLKQEKAREEKSPKIDYRYTGPITKKQMEESRYTKRWFEPRYKRYKPSGEAMETIKKNINDYKIVAFMGTWCPDSHRDVPRFYKILDEAGYDMDNLKVYALNHGMHSKTHEEKDLNITNVPTFIFYKNGKEVNRYVEHARQSLAKDIAKKVSGQD